MWKVSKERIGAGYSDTPVIPEPRGKADTVYGQPQLHSFIDSLVSKKKKSVVEKDKEIKRKKVGDLETIEK